MLRAAYEATLTHGSTVAENAAIPVFIVSLCEGTLLVLRWTLSAYI